jgi:Cu+-exporting ATPase
MCAPWRSSPGTIGIVATLVGGYPIFHEAVENLFERRMTMELSMTIALGAALLIGEFFTALVISLFVLIAEVLEGLTVGRGRRAIEELVNLLPRSGTVRRNGRVTELPIEEIQIGDRLLIDPGSKILVAVMLSSLAAVVSAYSAYLATHGRK